MHRFLGIILRISITPQDGGGYPAYFADHNTSVRYSTSSSETLPASMGFVAAMPSEFRMSLNRFKQIRGAFHPEDKLSANGVQDKCYQLRAAMNELNACSLANFVPEANLAFDEGGVACRSRYCPVRQYNKDKPDKFRVDFFMLAGSTTRIIYHIDFYQGRNDSNVGILEEYHDTPTTMKAVLNAVALSGLDEGTSNTNGYRVLSLDNRYQCPQLAFLLKSK